MASDMASPITATVYPGTCMFEGTNLSEGRGTVRPFELLGSPFTNSTWSDAMRNLPNPIPNTSFRPACFAPTDSKWLGNTSCGIEVYVDLCSDGRCSDAGDSGGSHPYETFDPVYLGVSLLSTARRLFSSQSGNATSAFQWLYNGSNSSLYDVDVLSGGPLIREGIEAGMSPDEMKADQEDQDHASDVISASGSSALTRACDSQIGIISRLRITHLEVE
jgi:uncharacterized protein YbbC (DUF1343 family)